MIFEHSISLIQRLHCLFVPAEVWVMPGRLPFILTIDLSPAGVFGHTKDLVVILVGCGLHLVRPILGVGFSFGNEDHCRLPVADCRVVALHRSKNANAIGNRQSAIEK
jgi:hypothetical protein